MSVKTSIAGMITAIMALSVPLVYADQAPGDKEATHQEKGWEHGDKDNMMGSVLGLTEDQEKQVKDLREKQKNAMKSSFEQIKTNRQALDAEIVKATPNMNKVNDIQTQFKTIQAQLVDAQLTSILAIKKILSPEQFAGYMALHKEKEMMMHHKGHKHWMGNDKDPQMQGAEKQQGERDEDKE